MITPTIKTQARELSLSENQSEGKCGDRKKEHEVAGWCKVSAFISKKFWLGWDGDSPPVTTQAHVLNQQILLSRLYPIDLGRFCGGK